MKEKIAGNALQIILKCKKTFAVSAAAFLALYTFLFGLWNIPVIGFGFTRSAEITVFDVAYLLLVSLMVGALATLIRHKAAVSKTPFAAAGGISAFVTAICPACQGITVAALGSTVAFIPLEFISSYVWLLQMAAILMLGLSLRLVSHSIFTKSCVTCAVTSKAGHRTLKGSALYDNNIVFAALMILVLMLAANSFMVPTAFATLGNGNGGSISLRDGFEYGPKVTLKPMPLAAGENPRFQGYKTIVKPLPTISELTMSPPTGDIMQDIANNVIPRGTPWYGQEAGMSFDDPIAAQKLWANGRAIQLNTEEQKRWERLVNSFTCDYCCGSPQNPTIITRCGCAHSQAAQGMAKWFIKNYGNKFSDEEIYGEMARWYALWYPGPTVKRIVQELQAA